MNNDFLIENTFLLERIGAGIDIHPSDAELKTFQAMAKVIDADRHFTIYGCQECNQTLVKFVYENYVEEDLPIKELSINKKKKWQIRK